MIVWEWDRWRAQASRKGTKLHVATLTWHGCQQVGVAAWLFGSKTGTVATLSSVWEEFCLQVWKKTATKCKSKGTKRCKHAEKYGLYAHGSAGDHTYIHGIIIEYLCSILARRMISGWASSQLWDWVSPNPHQIGESVCSARCQGVRLFSVTFTQETGPGS